MQHKVSQNKLRLSTPSYVQRSLNSLSGPRVTKPQTTDLETTSPNSRRLAAATTVCITRAHAPAKLASWMVAAVDVDAVNSRTLQAGAVKKCVRTASDLGGRQSEKRRGEAESTFNEQP